MENIDISKWVKSALVIDDKWAEVKDLIRMLNANGVSTSYYNPNPDCNIDLERLGFSGFTGIEGKVKDSIEAQLQDFMRTMLRDVGCELRKDSITGYNLIFLDIELGFEAARDNVKFQISKAVTLLRDFLKRESSPYGVVLWSHEPKSAYEGGNGEPQSVLEEVIKLLYNGSLKDKPKPLFVIDLKKSSFKQPEDFALLADKLNEGLQQSKMVRFFAHWNKEVLDSAAQTFKNIQDYAEVLLKAKQGESDKANSEVPTLEEEFFNILKYSTFQHFGFARTQEGNFTDVLSRYSFSYLSSQLHDKLRSHFSLKKTLGVFKTHTDCIYDQITEDKKGKNIPLRKVLAGLDFRSLLEPVLGDLKKICIPGLIHCTEDVNTPLVEFSKAPIYINITPPCDVAQSRKNASLYLSGELIRAKTYAEVKEYADQKIKGERYYKSPPMLDGEDNYIAFYFDLRQILGTIANKGKLFTRFVLKDSMFTDLMQKFGYHNSRLGARTFH